MPITLIVSVRIAAYFIILDSCWSDWQRRHNVYNGLHVKIIHPAHKMVTDLRINCNHCILDMPAEIGEIGDPSKLRPGEKP